MISQQQIFLIEAFQRGYRVDINGKIISPTGKYISTSKTNKGYLTFNIRVGGKIRRVPVHRLQAFQKYGNDLLKEGIVVRHMNAIKTDNSETNINIGTQTDNMQDKPEEQRKVNSSNPIHNHNNIINDRYSGMKYKELMEKYNISSKGTLSFIINKSLEKVAPHLLTA